MSGVEEATWVGGPWDGETLGIPRGCRSLDVTTTITAADDELILDQWIVITPIRMVDGSLKIMYFEGRTERNET